MGQLLADLKYETIIATKNFSRDQLKSAQILVVSPENDLGAEEIEAIIQFVNEGGGLLLVSNSRAMINPMPGWNKLATSAGLQFNEYLNYPPRFLQRFRPHFVTGNINRLRVGNAACLSLTNGAYPVAFTKATQQPVIACAQVGRGRVVAVGDTDLFDDLLDDEDNKAFVTNTFCWLATNNIIDIEEIIIPETVKWGQTATVLVRLHNSDAELRPQIECTLESDADALISEPARNTSTPTLTRACLIAPSLTILLCAGSNSTSHRKPETIQFNAWS